MNIIKSEKIKPIDYRQLKTHSKQVTREYEESWDRIFRKAKIPELCIKCKHKITCVGTRYFNENYNVCKEL